MKLKQIPEHYGGQQARSLPIFQERTHRKKQLFRLYIRLFEYTYGNVGIATRNTLTTVSNDRKTKMFSERRKTSNFGFHKLRITNVTDNNSKLQV